MTNEDQHDYRNGFCNVFGILRHLVKIQKHMHEECDEVDRLLEKLHNQLQRGVSAIERASKKEKRDAIE